MSTYLIIADMEGKKHPALHRGIELARRSGAHVHIVAFVHDSYISQQEREISVGLQQKVMNTRGEQIDKALADIDCSGVIIDRVDIIWERDISSWVIETAQPESYSMIIKTGHRTENLVHTTSDWRILRQSTVNNMIVARKKWKQKNHILCAINLGGKERHNDLNRKIIAQGKELAELFDSQLYCCYAVPIPTVLADLDIVDRHKIEKEGKQRARGMFLQLANEYDLDTSALSIKAGKPEKVIPSIANKLKARMVVVGTVGRSGIKGKLLGNTAEQVVHHLRTDLLAVKP